MKRIFSIVFACLSLGAAGQNFSDKGFVSAGLPTKPVPDTFSIRTVQPGLTDAEKASMKKQLAARIQKALDNMQDEDSFRLRSFYTYLWTQPVYDSIIVELREVKKYLDGFATNPGVSFDYVPSPATLERDLFGRTVNTVRDSISANGTQRHLLLIQENAFKKWLLQRFRQSFEGPSGINPIEMDFDYRKAWRDLESWNSKARLYGDSLEKMYNSVVDCSNTAALQRLRNFISTADVERNDIVIYLRRQKFFKDWLWLNEGFINMNPLVATDSSRMYPASEPNSGRKKQPSAEQMDLKTLLTTSVVLNKLVLPVSAGETRNTIVGHYDAADEFKSYGMPSRLHTKNKMMIAVHNVYKNHKVNLVFADSALLDRSSFMGDVDALATQIGSLAFPAGQIGTLLGLFNPAPVGRPQGTITAVTRGPATGLEAARNADVLELDNGRKVELSEDINVDKKNIIKASLNDPEDKSCNSCIPRKTCDACFVPDYIIDGFITRDACYSFDYADSTKLKKQANAMLERFECFLDTVNACKLEMEDLRRRLVTIANSTTYLVSIANRSLPPRDYTETRDNNPVYQTYLFTADIPENATQRTFTINETKPKAGSATETETKAVARQRVRIGKLHFLDLSAGIAFTTKEYMVTKQTGSALPETKPGDQFKAVAGLHIYPFGLFKLDDRFPGPLKHRTSLFLGVSIPKALDNFYVGAAYDPVPGIRVTVGGHFFKSTRYEIFNNQVVDQATGLSFAGTFVSATIEPATFIKLIGLLD
ncbi:MAG TPA: hypothetical protein VGB46_00190 [Flavisolibacter sp.]|jgi:hypothetical protein